MSTWTSFVKIWTVRNCEFDANFLTFLDLCHLLFALETIGVSWIIKWLLIFEKRAFQFWRKIWFWVVIILLQLYQFSKWKFHAHNTILSAFRSLFGRIKDNLICIWDLLSLLTFSWCKSKSFWHRFTSTYILQVFLFYENEDTYIEF